MTKEVIIRNPKESELYRLPEIENSAAQAFEKWAQANDKEFLGLYDADLDRLLEMGTPLVAVIEGKVVGFVIYKLHAEESTVFIAELDVDYDYQGNKIGAQLVEGVIALNKNYKKMALTTYSHIPWNAPYYESRLGFKTVETDKLPDFLKEILDKEKNSDMPEPEKRVAMARNLQ